MRENSDIRLTFQTFQKFVQIHNVYDYLLNILGR